MYFHELALKCRDGRFHNLDIANLEFIWLGHGTILVWVVLKDPKEASFSGLKTVEIAQKSKYIDVFITYKHTLKTSQKYSMNKTHTFF